MKLPWQNRSGLAQAVAVLASILTISLGLCGANFLVFSRSTHDSMVPFLMVTGSLESIAILGSALGLLLVALLYLVQKVRRHFSAASKDEE